MAKKKPPQPKIAPPPRPPVERPNLMKNAAQARQQRKDKRKKC